MQPIYLKLSVSSEKLPTGSSRFWGNPDLPENFSFPTYTDASGEKHHYNFICQINLEELAGSGITSVLPKKGLLSFFALIDYYMGNFDAPLEIGGNISKTDAVRVLYFPSCKDLKEITSAEKEEAMIVPHELRIEYCRSVPPLTDEHALFALPDHRPWETWDIPFEDWHILFQIDSFEGEDFSLNFMDCGVMDFLISHSDLQRLRFDNVRAIILST